MKGLLIKDIRLLAPQKGTLLLLWMVGIFMLFTYDSFEFSIVYVLFVTGTLTMSTISYDDFNKGMSFLMTLPITRSQYIKSKYVFLIGNLLLTATIISALAYVISGVRNMPLSIEDVLLTAAMGMCCLMIFMAIILPFMFKFGAEKGRIVMVIIAGAVFAVAFFASKITTITNVGEIIAKLETLSLPIVSVGAILVCVLLLLISMCISIGIIKKKEY